MNQDPPRAVTDTEIASFERDGVVLLRQMIDEDWRDRLAEAVDRELAAPGEHSLRFGDDKRFFSGNMGWLRDEALRRYALKSPLPKLAAQLLRSSKVNFLCDQLFLKEPATGDRRTPWHQDVVVFPVKGRKTVSFWTSLDPVTPDTGAMEFIRGSHSWQRRFQPRRFSGEAIYPEVEGYEETPDFEAERDKHDVLTWSMQPGDLVAFAFETVHGAPGNGSNVQRRRAYTLRYCGDDVTYWPHGATMPMLLNDEIAEGAPLDSRLFPIAWRASDQSGEA